MKIFLDNFIVLITITLTTISFSGERENQDAALISIMKKYGVKVESKISDSDRTYARLAVFEQYILNEYLRRNPGIISITQIELFRDNQVSRIEVIQNRALLLNISRRKCRWNDGIVKIDPTELRNRFCFSEENIKYFKDVKMASFRISRIENAADIKDRNLRNELKMHVQEKIKAQAIRTFLVNEGKSIE